MGGWIAYEGPSKINGEPIVVIVTDATRNRKTGAMLQTWILRADVEPHHAVRDGDDEAICGSCPLRAGGACYVATHQAPLSIWRAWKRGSYGCWKPSHARGHVVRLGAYGDPAAMPAAQLHRLLRHAEGWTGYTHQWREPRFRWLRRYVMASVETPQAATRAQVQGFRTFRITAPDGEPQLLADERTCPSESGVTCADCQLCDGLGKGRRVNIAIPAHGPMAKRIHTGA